MKLSRPDPNSKAVYSTEPEALGSQGGRESGEEAPVAPSVQTVRLGLQRRKGDKIVTIISGVKGPPDLLKDLARGLKTLSGAGGTWKAESGAAEIEIQGDHRPKVEAYLRGQGYAVKRVGG